MYVFYIRKLYIFVVPNLIMTYVRIKTIKGRSYKYLVAGKRVDGKVQQKVIKYLGPANPVYKTGRKREKSNASIYIRELTKNEMEELTKSTKSNHSFTRDRAKIILFSSQKLFAKQIAEKLSCEERKIRLAIKEFNNKGLNALQRGKAKGAIPKFSDMTKKIILMHFAKNPPELGLYFTAWTLPRFKKYLVENKIVESISIETLRQIIMKSGAKLQRSKRWQYSPDKEFDKKNLQ